MIDVAEFWVHAERGELRLPRCAACENWVWYPRDHCAACGSASISWDEIAPTGTLFSWTRMHHRYVADLEPVLPVTIGIVDLDGGPRIIGWLAGFESSPVIGCRVDGAFESIPPLADSRLVFRPSDLRA